jgi:hypothetical protein
VLDIWKVNWLYFMLRNLEHTGLKNEQCTWYLFLVWINSKPLLPCARQAVLTRGSDGGSRYKLPWPDYIPCVFDFYYLSIAQIRLYRTNPSYSAIASLCFRCGVKIFSPSPFAGLQKFFFLQEPKLVVGVLADGEGLIPP